MIRNRAIHYRGIHYGAIHYGAIHYGAIHFSSVCHPIIGCGPRNSKSKLHRSGILDSCFIEELGILLSFGFGWLTINILEFATNDTRRLLPGRILVLVEQRVANVYTYKKSPLDCVARRNVTSPPQTAIRRSNPYRLKSRSQEGSRCDRLAHQASPLEKDPFGRALNIRDRAKNFHSIHPHVRPGQEFLPYQPLSRKRSSSASAQVH